MSPEVVPRTEEVDGKLADFVRQVTDIQRNSFGITNLARPPPVIINKSSKDSNSNNYEITVNIQFLAQEQFNIWKPNRDQYDVTSYLELGT